MPPSCFCYFIDCCRPLSSISHSMVKNRLVSCLITSVLQYVKYTRSRIIWVYRLRLLENWICRLALMAQKVNLWLFVKILTKLLFPVTEWEQSLCGCIFRWMSNLFPRLLGKTPWDVSITLNPRYFSEMDHFESHPHLIFFTRMDWLRIPCIFDWHQHYICLIIS